MCAWPSGGRRRTPPAFGVDELSSLSDSHEDSEELYSGEDQGKDGVPSEGGHNERRHGIEGILQPRFDDLGLAEEEAPYSRCDHHCGVIPPGLGRSDTPA